MNFAVLVEVRPRAGIADPQGQTIERSLPALGFAGASDVRVGKILRFSLEARDERSARAELTQMCEQLLANPVIEDYEIFLDPAEPAEAAEAAAGERR